MLFYLQKKDLQINFFNNIIKIFILNIKIIKIENKYYFLII